MGEGGIVSALDRETKRRCFVSRRRGADCTADSAKVRRGGRLRGELGVVLGDRLVPADVAQRGYRSEEGHPGDKALSRVTVSWEPASSDDGLRADVLDFVIDALSLLRDQSLGLRYHPEPTPEELGKFVASLAEP
jgi:hypothetical protein